MKKIYLFLIIMFVANSSTAQEQATTSEHYLFPEFQEGVVLMKSGRRNKASLNYHLVSHEMIFDKKGEKLALGWSDIVSIDTVFMGDRKFVLLNMNFVELLNNSTWTLYAEHKCKIRELGQPAGFGGRSETSAIRTHGGITANGYLYELELPNNYDISPYTHYWLKRKGKVKKFVNMKTLKKLYKRKKKQLESYINNYHIKYEEQEDLINLIQHMESI